MRSQPNASSVESDVATLLPHELYAEGWRLHETGGKWKAKNSKLRLFSSACDYPGEAINAARALADGKTQVLNGDGSVEFKDPPAAPADFVVRCPECGTSNDLDPHFEDRGKHSQRIVSFTCPKGHLFANDDPKALGEKPGKVKAPAESREIPKDVFAFYVESKYLDPSTTNARQDFDEEKLAELGLSIATHGLLEPLIVRPAKKAGRYEIVAGERRFRAAKLAKLNLIPCIVRRLTDREAEEIQTIENDQREDLNPIERGAGYLKLLERHGHTPETLAAAVGKSKTFIYDQIKLAKLPDLARKALLEGRLPQSTATLIARIPSESYRENAAQEIVAAKPYPGASYTNEPLSFRHAKSLIERKFSTQLKGAPFSREDATLVPEAGACSTCPKLVGNNRAEFPEGRADVCTDPQCFNRKVAAYDARTRAKAKDNEIKVLPASTCKELFSYYGDFKNGSGYINLADQCPEDKQKKKRSYKQLLGDEAQPVLAIHPKNHRAFYLMPERDAAKILEKNHKIKIQVATVARTSDASRSDNSYEAREKARQEKRKNTLAWLLPACNEAAGLLVAEVEKLNKKLSETHATTVLYRVTAGTSDLYVTEEMAKRRGWKNSSASNVEAALKPMSFAQLAGVAFEMIFWCGFNDYQAELEKESLHELRGFGIDFDVVAAKYKTAAPPPDAKPKAKAAGRAK